MELHNKNQSELLPYEKLALLGIDREKGGQPAPRGQGKAGFR